MSEFESILPSFDRRKNASERARIISLVAAVAASVLVHVGLLFTLAEYPIDFHVPDIRHPVRTKHSKAPYVFTMSKWTRPDTAIAEAQQRRNQTGEPLKITDQSLREKAIQKPDAVLPLPTQPLFTDVTLAQPDTVLDHAVVSAQLTGVKTDNLAGPPEVLAFTPGNAELKLPALDDIAAPEIATTLPIQNLEEVNFTTQEIAALPRVQAEPVLFADGEKQMVAYLQDGVTDEVINGAVLVIPGGYGVDMPGLTNTSDINTAFTPGPLNADGSSDAGVQKGLREIVGGNEQTSAVLGVQVRLGEGITFDVPTDEEANLKKEEAPDDKEAVKDARQEEGGEAIEESESLAKAVDIRVKRTPDPDGRGGYYEVLIDPIDNCVELPDVAKDVLFIIDHSGSIYESRLAQFRQQTSDALNYLNAKDRFNIVTFASNSQAFFTGYAAPSQKNLSYARKRLKSLTCGGTTDVFGGIGPYVKRGNDDKDRPLLVFLMTDGKSTINWHRGGDITVDNRDTSGVLRAIASSNPGNVSIYPFSAGADTDRILMDFMARLNRGTPVHAEDHRKFNGTLSSYLRQHLSVVARDFHWIAEGRIGDNLYPRTLPHLYRSEPFVIYGRYENPDEDLVLTLVGFDAVGTRRRLVFKRKFSQCELYKMPEDGKIPLREQWIAQKALHLLAEYVTSQAHEQGNSEELTRKRQELTALLNQISAFSAYSELLKP